MSAINPEFTPHHLVWEVQRSRRSFHVRVVEPTDYEPSLHPAIFEKVITDLVFPGGVPVDRYNAPARRSPDDFDLITFPEAFAPAATLLSVLRSMSQLPTLGCVHVGLRPSVLPDQHLFTGDQLATLLNELRHIKGLVVNDLVGFETWLFRQRHAAMFNVACLFTLDADSRLRVCLHPKGVRSPQEWSVLPDHTMEEADMLTLVTLRPRNKSFMSVNLQPLICSDALNLTTDRGTTSLLEEINRQIGVFEAPPDHIDIVSVATCTPHRTSVTSNEEPHREWHQDFRDALVRAAQGGGQERHAFATFVLSNFENLPGQKKGGLSGVFEPVSPKVAKLHDDVAISVYGKARSKPNSNNRWQTPDDGSVLDWSALGYLATVRPTAASSKAAVKVFGFTMGTILRNQSLWKRRHSVTSCRLRLAHWSGARDLTFSEVEQSA